MDDKLHNELIENLKDGVRFAKGEKSNATVFAVLSAADIKAIRASVDMSQAVFAREFQLNLDTLKGWEQAKRKPDAAATNFLRMIQADPEYVQRTIAA